MLFLFTLPSCRINRSKDVANSNIFESISNCDFSFLRVAESLPMLLSRSKSSSISTFCCLSAVAKALVGRYLFVFLESGNIVLVYYEAMKLILRGVVVFCSMEFDLL